MSNFGFSHLRVVNPYHVAYTEARSAVNAAAVLRESRQFDTVAEAVADCTLVVGTASQGRRTPRHSLHELADGAARIREHAATGATALLFGTEKFGLGNEDLSHCHWLMYIPTRSEHASMNLGQSVAVCLYELIREQAAGKAGPRLRRPARSGDVEIVTHRLLEALRISGYVEPRTAPSTEQKVRRMVHRLGLTEDDAKMWLGITRQLLWRLHQPAAILNTDDQGPA
jgi:tRNA/rRNA methyltransferase